jgi:O-antigen ligase/polysaccharide polymerase Wzy-like membrane protein
MPGAVASPRRSSLAASLLCGFWAAAIAAAPSLTSKALLAAPAVALPLVWWTVQRPARWVALFLATALLLPPLPIAIGNSGPHPCLVFAALGVFCGLMWLSEWRVELSLRRTANLNTAFLVLFGVLLLSVAPAAWHSGEVAAAGSLARVALFGISIYVYFYTAHGPGAREFRAPVRALYWIAVASALFACVDFYYQFPAPAGYGPQFVWLDSGIYRRAQGLFYEAGTLGNFCSFFLVMIAVAFSRPRAESPVSRKALLAGGAVFFAALVLSYSRSSLLNIAIACAMLVWLNRKRVPLAKVALVLAIALAAGALLTWRVFPNFAETYWLRLSASAENLFTATNGVLSGRVESWRFLAAWIEANPWQAFFGIGYKTLPYSDYLGSAVVADNMYLSLLVETGIAGLAALLWLNFAILRAALRAARSGDPRASFYGAWMVCFWSGQMVQMFSADVLTFWRVLPVYFWILALAVRA